MIEVPVKGGSTVLVLTIEM